MCKILNFCYLAGLGCSINAINILQHACSGKSECSFPVFTDELYNTDPCPDMKSYLEVSYECIPGTCRSTSTSMDLLNWLFSNVKLSDFSMPDTVADQNLNHVSFKLHDVMLCYVDFTTTLWFQSLCFLWIHVSHLHHYSLMLHVDTSPAMWPKGLDVEGWIIHGRLKCCPDRESNWHF